MAEVIADPFEQIFQESVRCTTQTNCDLAPSKQEATRWIRSFASNGGYSTNALDGMEIVASIGPESMDGTCMIHCDLEKPNAKCRILTPPNPNACRSAILTVVDRGDPKPDPNIAWDGGTMSIRDEFSNVRNFMNRFAPCQVNDGVNKESIENSFVPSKRRGKQAVNTGVGFTDNQGTRYGFCYIKSGAAGLARTNLTLPDMRQPSGLGSLMMATPNPRFGGSLTERQCQDLLRTHYQMCLEKFNDRDQQNSATAGMGYDTSQCDGLPNRCRKGEVGCESRGACLLRKKRDACAGITNWDVPEPATLRENETNLFGIPDALTHCKQLGLRAGRAGRATRAGATNLPTGFAPRSGLLVFEDPVMPSNLSTQLPHTTMVVMEMPDERIQLRLDNCLEKCEAAVQNADCAAQGPFSPEDFCTETCEPLILSQIQLDDTFSTYSFDCKLTIQKELDILAPGVSVASLLQICDRAIATADPPLKVLDACRAIESDSLSAFRDACASELPAFKTFLSGSENEALMLACKGLGNVPVDCQVAWSEWGACSKPVCGGGKQTRTATIVKEPTPDGIQCPELTETRDCNTNACVDCKVSDWSAWGVCNRSCGGGTQSRTRTITQQPGPGGAACPSNLTETRPCNTQICCDNREWSQWEYNNNPRIPQCVRRQAATGNCPQGLETKRCTVNAFSEGEIDEQCSLECVLMNYM